MGQKVSPHGLRVGVIKDWDSKWYADKKFADFLVEDNKVREYVKKKLYAAGVSKVVIERAADNKIKVIVMTAKPGMVIGRSGTGIDDLKAELEKMTKKSVVLDIREIRRAELDAQLTAESIAQALERRVSFRRAMKQAIGRTMKAGAKGIKVLTSGRLGGAEIARSEKYSEGNVPLHTLRADIDYGFAEADTTYGKLGIKSGLTTVKDSTRISSQRSLKKRRKEAAAREEKAADPAEETETEDLEETTEETRELRFQRLQTLESESLRKFRLRHKLKKLRLLQKRLQQQKNRRQEGGTRHVNA